MLIEPEVSPRHDHSREYRPGLSMPRQRSQARSATKSNYYVRFQIVPSSSRVHPDRAGPQFLALLSVSTEHAQWRVGRRSEIITLSDLSKRNNARKYV